MIEARVKDAVRDIPDFPQPGIIFKDITPILKDPNLCKDIVDDVIDKIKGLEIDLIAGIESRGFLFGLMLATKLGVPFVPIRKKGKLPHKTICHSYDLEYGSAILEVHQDAFPNGSRVLIHDDLLATGGTVEAASILIGKLGGRVAGYSFLIELDFLDGRKKLASHSDRFISIARY